MGINTRYLNAGFLDGGYAYTERKYIYLKEDNQTIFGVSNSNLSIRPFLIKKNVTEDIAMKTVYFLMPKTIGSCKCFQYCANQKRYDLVLMVILLAYSQLQVYTKLKFYPETVFDSAFRRQRNSSSGIYHSD
jgi:hypothetical protein